MVPTDYLLSILIYLLPGERRRLRTKLAVLLPFFHVVDGRVTGVRLVHKDVLLIWVCLGLKAKPSHKSYDFVFGEVAVDVQNQNGFQGNVHLEGLRFDVLILRAGDQLVVGILVVELLSKVGTCSQVA